MSRAQTRRPGWWPAAALAAAGLVLLAGCGTAATASGTGSASTTANGSTAPANTQMDAFATCLTENGVTLPEGSGDLQGNPADGSGSEGSAPPDAPAPGDGDTPPAPEGVDADTWAAALEACGDAMPKG